MHSMFTENGSTIRTGLVKITRFTIEIMIFFLIDSDQNKLKLWSTKYMSVDLLLWVLFEIMTIQ